MTMQIVVRKRRGNTIAIRVYKYSDEMGDITPMNNLTITDNPEMAKAMVISMVKANPLAKSRIKWEI